LFWFDSVIIDGFVNLLAKITITLSKVAAWTDRYIVDGFLNFIVALAEAIANFARKFQGGKVQYYLFSMLVILLVLFILQTVF
jgi:NADH-quinone oxidoreductase subunit L